MTHERDGTRAALRLAGALAAIGAAGLIATLSWSVPSGCGALGCSPEVRERHYALDEAPHVYDASGVLVGDLPGTLRMWAALDDVPPELRDGVVAVEDRRFREHAGVDLRSILRAVRANLAAGGVDEGASTLTMQLARNLWEEELAGVGPWRRKVVELRLAGAIERDLDKDRILELYLNRIYMGEGVYGVRAAARTYFQRDLDALRLGEIATLVGLIKTPERYNPIDDPERARSRRDVVLGVLERGGVATAEAVAEALAEELEVREGPLPRASSWYLAAVSRELRALFPDAADRVGLRIHTALDMDAQTALERSLRRQIQRVEGGALGRWRHAVPEQDPPERAEGTSPYLQAAGVILESSSGAVQAVVGGRSFEHSQFDRIFQARRQPGSAFKPLVYAAALDAGTVTLAEPVRIDVVRYATDDGDWVPRDGVDEEEAGRGLPARMALARSSNRAAVRVGEEVGVERVSALAAALGIESQVQPYPSSFLGASEVRPIELAAAYAAFGNGGLRVRPHTIVRVEDRSGTVLFDAPPSPEPALDPATAYLVRSALQDAVLDGTGWRAVASGYRGPVAGKTGTTNEGKDAWFIGLNHERVLGVWVGFDEPRTIALGAAGGNLAAPVWGRVMAELYPDRVRMPSSWTRLPDGVVSLRIDPRSGDPVDSSCRLRDVSYELFLRESAPPPICVERGIDRGIGGWIRGAAGDILDLILQRRRRGG